MRALTAFGIAALLAVPVLATDFTWEGDRLTGAWNTALNWDQGSSFPGDPADERDDDAIVTSKVTYWPYLTGSYTIVGLTMGSSADLDVNGYTLTVSGTFTVNSNATVTISDSSTGGSISCGSIVINGGTTFTVNGCTVQTS